MVVAQSQRARRTRADGWPVITTCYQGTRRGAVKRGNTRQRRERTRAAIQLSLGLRRCSWLAISMRRMVNEVKQHGGPAAKGQQESQQTKKRQDGLVMGKRNANVKPGACHHACSGTEAQQGSPDIEISNEPTINCSSERPGDNAQRAPLRDHRKQQAGEGRKDEHPGQRKLVGSALLHDPLRCCRRASSSRPNRRRTLRPASAAKCQFMIRREGTKTGNMRQFNMRQFKRSAERGIKSLLRYYLQLAGSRQIVLPDRMRYSNLMRAISTFRSGSLTQKTARRGGASYTGNPSLSGLPFAVASLASSRSIIADAAVTAFRSCTANQISPNSSVASRSQTTV